MAHNMAIKSETKIRVLIFLLAAGIMFSCRQSEVSDKRSEAVNGAEAHTMLDLSMVNNPDEEWCYSPKSTTVIGVPFMPRSVQVTYDGAIFTGDAELCFFYGDSLKPVMARQKTYYDGWIPMIEYAWEEDGLLYAMEMFGAAVDGIGPSNTIQFIQITCTNTSSLPIRASLTSGSRHSGIDHRFRLTRSTHDPATRFEMKNGCLLRDGHLIYTYPKPCQIFAVIDSPYGTPFLASDYSILENSVTGLSTTKKMLDPGESFQVNFRMPNYPVSVEAQEKIDLIKNADYTVYRQSTIDYWKERIEGNTCFAIPEKRVNDTYKAGLVHLMLATRHIPGEKKRQGSGLPYDQLFFNDYVDMRRLYDLSGQHEFVDINVQWLIENQNQEGMFLDPVLTHGQEIMASHGQALVSLANHYLVTRDTVYARRIFPTVQKAVEWMYRKHQENPNGLMPASTPFDAEMIKGHYTSHNLWCLLALRDAIRVARGLGEEDDVRKWSDFHASYNRAVLEAIEISAKKEGGYVPTGLYDFITGPAARKGFREHRTNQDWENNLLIYPTEVLEASDYRIQATLDTIRSRKYREGIMTYRNGMHLHQYATVNQANQYLAINDQKHALLDLYHILLHNGSTHEGYENMVEPWEDMDPWPIPPPHAWAAAKTALLIRNMMVREHGGEAGLQEEDRDLYLFSVISPAWNNKKDTLRIQDAVTEMGKLSAQLELNGQGASITIQSQFHSPPRYIKMAIPWFVELNKVKSNAQWSDQLDGYLVFSPDVTSIELKWKTKRGIHRNTYQDILWSYREENSLKWRGLKDAQIIPGGKGFLLEDEVKYPAEPLSFELVKKAFQKEYLRRFEEYKTEGKQPMIIGPPPAIPVRKEKE